MNGASSGLGFARADLSKLVVTGRILPFSFVLHEIKYMFFTFQTLTPQILELTNCSQVCNINKG